MCCAVFARIKLGNETFKTPTKNNAGGNVNFDNFKMSFNKQKDENTLKVGQTANNHPPAFKLRSRIT